MNEKEVLIYIVDLFSSYLEELNACPINDFIHGEMTAYVEALEIIQQYQPKVSDKLNCVIEEKYEI